MSAIETWSATAANNNAASPDGFPEGMAQNGYNNSAREVMAAVRAWFTDPEWQILHSGFTVTRLSDSQFTVDATDASLLFPIGRRVLFAPGLTTAVVSAVSYGAPNTTVTVISGTVPVGITTAYCYFGKSLRGGAFLEAGSVIGQLALHTSAAALGTAAYKNHGTAIGDAALHTSAAALASAAYLASGTAIGQVPVHSSTGPLKKGAYSDVARVYAKRTANGADLSGAIQVIGSLSNIAVPGTPDGVKKYRVNAHIDIHNTSGSTSDQPVVTLKLGAAGTVGDATVMTTEFITGFGGAARDWSMTIAGFEITPAAGDKVSLCFTSVIAHTIYGTSPRFGWLEIVEIPPA